MGRLTELERGCYRCEDPIVKRVSLWPLALSSSLFGRFYFMHSLRSKILHRSIKKNERKKLKMKKVRDTFRIFFNFFEIFDFLKIFEIFSKNVIFRKFFLGFDIVLFFNNTPFRRKWCCFFVPERIRQDC